MQRISLFPYKESKQYLSLFEKIIKNQGLNKDEFLLSQGISPTSFRRARSSEQKVGLEIIEKLSKIYDYKIPTSTDVEKAEALFNQIYNEVYFKIYDNFELFKEKLEEELNKKSLLYPLINLFKIFLSLNENKQRNDILKNNRDLFYELKKYETFFTEDIMKVYDVVKIQFVNDIPEEYLQNEYTNALINYSLASKSNLKKDYISSLYFADKTRKICLEENNYLRLFHLNLIFMHNYNSLGNYEKCYELASNQLLSLKSLQVTNFVFSTTELHLVTACLGLKYYKEVIEILSSKEVYQSTEIYALLIAKFMVNQNEYQELYTKTIQNNQNREEDLYIIQTLNTFLHKNDKNSLMKLEKTKMRESLLKILKRNFFKA